MLSRSDFHREAAAVVETIANGNWSDAIDATLNNMALSRAEACTLTACVVEMLAAIAPDDVPRFMNIALDRVARD